MWDVIGLFNYCSLVAGSSKVNLVRLGLVILTLFMFSGYVCIIFYRVIIRLSSYLSMLSFYSRIGPIFTIFFKVIFQSAGIQA